MPIGTPPRNILLEKAEGPSGCFIEIVRLSLEDATNNIIISLMLVV